MKLPSKKISSLVASLPASSLETTESVDHGNFRFQFDSANPHIVVVKKGDDEEKELSLSEISLRMISCEKTKTAYDGKKYIPDENGEDTYICLMLLCNEMKQSFCFGTMLLRKSLAKLTAHVKEQSELVVDELKAAGHGDLEKQVFLFCKWRPVLKVITNQNGSYLRINKVEYDTVEVRDVDLAANAFRELDEEMQAAIESMKYYRLPG